MKTQRNKQVGSALLASLILVVIFTLIGMTAAEKGVLAEKASTEYHDRMLAEEAAEISAAAIIDRIDSINGPLNASTAPSVRVLESASDSRVGSSAAWDPVTLSNLINTEIGLSGTLVRTTYGEPDLSSWEQRGIVNAGLAGTVFDVAINRRVQTYAFIESYYSLAGVTSTRTNEKGVYVITVKATVYAPFAATGSVPYLPIVGAIEQTNTIIQVVHQKYY